MKKNMLAIIILALSLVNTVLAAVLIFSVVPAANRMNHLMGEVASMIDLELAKEEEDGEEPPVSMSDLEGYKIESKITCNLMPGTDGKNHFASIDSISLSLNTKAKDYSDVKKALDNNQSSITQMVTDIVGNYSIDNASISRNEMKEKALVQIQTRFNTEAIVDISLENLAFN